jgi:hypothetical protein
MGMGLPLISISEGEKDSIFFFETIKLQQEGATRKKQKKIIKKRLHVTPHFALWGSSLFLKPHALRRCSMFACRQMG